MKLAILTFPKAINYGAVLQSFALFKKLQPFCSQVCFLNHNCEAIEKTNSLFDFKNILSPKYTLAHIINFPNAFKRKQKFKDFWKKNFVFSNRSPNSFDAVIVGSDQVWNYNLTQNDWTYFLNFKKEKTKKIAFSASFGLSRIDDSKKEHISSLISDFDFLSVREQTGLDILKDLTTKSAQLTLDPTLLLSPKEWSFLIENKKENYIFVYTVFKSNELWNFAINLSKKTGLPIKSVAYSRLNTKRAKYDFSAGPKEWLSLLYNAKYVITNSFHGVAFSLNFSKQFFYSLPQSKDDVSSRLKDICERYNLSNREISKCENFCNINYAKIQKQLNAEREASQKFINSFLNSIKTEG